MSASRTKPVRTGRSGGVRCALRVYERFSWVGGNRLSLTLQLCGVGENLQLTAITAGGSQAVFFKLNTIGEDAFLHTLIDAMDVRGPALIKQDRHAVPMVHLPKVIRHCTSL